MTVLLAGGTFGSADTSSVWPEQAAVVSRCQHGATPPFWAQAGTVAVTPKLSTVDVTLQSGWPSEFSPMGPGMHAGPRSPLIIVATRSRPGPKLSSQTDSSTPLLPKACASCAVRTPGSPMRPSAAVHECVTSGQGHESVVHDVSGALESRQWTP